MHIHNFRFLFVLSIVSLTLTVAPACATSILTYTDLASWTVASTGDQTIDFNNGSQTNGFGVTFSGINGSLAIMDPIINTWADFGTGKSLFINMNNATPPYIRIMFNTPVTAFAVNLFTANPHLLAFSIIINGTPSTIASNDLGSPAAFFGVTSDTSFNFVDLKLLGTAGNSGAYELIDNVRFGTSQIDQTPEAATFLLIGSGLVGLMALRKRIMRPGRKTHGLIYKNRAMNNIVNT